MIRWWPFNRRQTLRARIAADIDARLAARKAARLKHAEAARKGHATRLRNAYTNDALRNSQVVF